MEQPAQRYQQMLEAQRQDPAEPVSPTVYR
jgi:hypothetical protein